MSVTMWASDSKVIPVVVLTAIFVYVVGVIIMTIALIHYGDENITKTTEESTITKTEESTTKSTTLTSSTAKSIHRMIAAKFM